MNNSLYKKILIKYLSCGHSTKGKDYGNPVRNRIKQETEKEIKDNERS